MFEHLKHQKGLGWALTKAHFTASLYQVLTCSSDTDAGSSPVNVCVCVCVYVCVVWLCMYIYVCVCVVCVFVLCVFCVYGYVESSDMEIESFAEHWRNVTSSSWQTWSADRLNKNKFDKIQTFWNEHVVTSSWQLKINKLICLSAVFLKQKAIPTC